MGGSGRGRPRAYPRIPSKSRTYPARVHHPGLAQDGKELGRPLQGLPGGLEGRLQDLLQGLPPGPLPGGPGHGEDGALHGAHHRLVAAFRPHPQGPAEEGPVQGPFSLQGLGEAPKDLGEDHPAVAPGAEEAPVGQGPGHLVHPGGVGEVQLPPGRLQGVEHVGARIPIGDGVDV
ncbi:hypothetical protein TthSNM33_01690 [Thermus thermophilus]|nr:hypothetical protein TthSNM33_01690 [Thermus thermophilus]